MNFDSYTDRVVGIAAALVNELTPGEHGGRPVDTSPERRPERCAAVLGRPVAAAQAAELAKLAGRLRPVFLAAEDGATDRVAELVNALLADYRSAPQLSRHDGEPWHLHFTSAAGTQWVPAAPPASRWSSTARRRAARRLPGRGLRPGVRRRLAQRVAPVLLRVLPQPHQGRRVPRPGARGDVSAPQQSRNRSPTSASDDLPAPRTRGGEPSPGRVPDAQIARRSVPPPASSPPDCSPPLPAASGHADVTGLVRIPGLRAAASVVRDVDGVAAHQGARTRTTCSSCRAGSTPTTGCSRWT